MSSGTASNNHDAAPGTPSRGLPAPSTGGTVHERCILVADDDDILLDAMATALRTAGYRVATASDGAEALDIVQQERPVAIVLDLRMPRVDGYELAQGLQRRGVQVPLVVVSASDDGRAVAERMGAAAFLPKPFSVAALIEALRQLGIVPSRIGRAAA